MKLTIAAAALAAAFSIASVAAAAPGNGNGNGQGNGQGNGNSASDAGAGNSGGNGKGNGLGKGLLEIEAKGNSAAAHAAKADPLHPSRLGRINGFLNASPNALANASEKSTIGLISKVYAGYLDAYLADNTQVTLVDDMAAVLEQVANKPLTPEVIMAINEKLASVDPVREASLGTIDPAVLAGTIYLAADTN